MPTDAKGGEDLDFINLVTLVASTAASELGEKKAGNPGGKVNLPRARQFINMLKTSSLVSVVQYSELLRATSDIGVSSNAIMEMYFVASIWYLVLTSVFSVGQFYLERRYARGSLRSLPPTPWQKIRANLTTLRRPKVA